MATFPVNNFIIANKSLVRFWKSDGSIKFTYLPKCSPSWRVSGSFLSFVSGSINASKPAAIERPPNNITGNTSWTLLYKHNNARRPAAIDRPPNNIERPPNNITGNTSCTLLYKHNNARRPAAIESPPNNIERPPNNITGNTSCTLLYKHNKGTLFKFVGIRTSYETFSQSRGVGKMKKTSKIIILFLESGLKLISRTGG